MADDLWNDGNGTNGAGTNGHRALAPERPGTGSDLSGFESFGLGTGDGVPVIGLEAQLIALYAERDQLQRAIGTADADEIIALVENANDGRASMTAQLESLYAERDELHRAIGTADAEEIVALVSNLRRRLGITLDFVDELLDQLKERK